MTLVMLAADPYPTGPLAVEPQMWALTPEQSQLVESALRIARDRYRDLAEVMRHNRVPNIGEEYDRLADEAGDLAMKIETSR